MSTGNLSQFYDYRFDWFTFILLAFVGRQGFRNVNVSILLGFQVIGSLFGLYALE